MQRKRIVKGRNNHFDFGQSEGVRGISYVFRSVLLFVLMLNFAFGQKSNNTYIETRDLQNWTREDFINNEIRTISAYSYEVDKKGKIKKDSLLLYKKQFDVSENKVFGIRSSNFSDFDRFLVLDNFETYYNANGQIVKYISGPYIEKKVNKFYINYEIKTYETDYQYDSLNREVKNIYKIIVNYYSILKRTKDTMSRLQTVSPKIEEYVYNSNNQKIEWHHTDDSTLYLNKYHNSASCLYCYPKYLHMKWEYDSLSNLTEQISFTQNGLIGYKLNFFYDDQKRLIKQIDSAGIGEDKRYWKRTTTYKHTDTDTGKIIAETYQNEKEPHIVPNATHYYDKEGREIKSHYHYTHYGVDYNYYCKYFYDNGKLVKAEKSNSDQEYIDVTTYSYNEKGLLKEEQIASDDKIVRIIRYYYE
ncbi:MAG: hypothetical protein FWH36_07000 [Lentimicrobiaceae bacterium]|nr:hypothetical protein [Lentimicrobiaceae bacterium]